MARQIQRFNNNVTKMEQLANREKLIQHHQKGEGLFLFKNRSKVADLTLPKASADGKKVVAPDGEFEGDSYFLKFVPKEVVIVKTIRSPQQDREEKIMTENKLILDQPEQVTEKGTVEHVQTNAPTAQPLNEQPGGLVPNEGKKLLNEDPMDGVTIIRD